MGYMIKNKETTKEIKARIELTPEENSEISKLQESFSKCIYEIGELQLKKMSIEKHLSRINEELEKKAEEILSYQHVENELLNKLDNKYGLENLSI